jgi:hypothetical protein
VSGLSAFFALGGARHGARVRMEIHSPMKVKAMYWLSSIRRAALPSSYVNRRSNALPTAARTTRRESYVVFYRSVGPVAKQCVKLVAPVLARRCTKIDASRRSRSHKLKPGSWRLMRRRSYHWLSLCSCDCPPPCASPSSAAPAAAAASVTVEVSLPACAFACAHDKQARREEY